VGEAADEPQVLPAGEVLVDGGVLAGQTDVLAHLLRGGGDVDAENGGAAAVRAQNRREDADARGLAGAVRPEKTEHGASFDLQVDTVEGDDLVELLAQAFHDDGRPGRGRKGSHEPRSRRHLKLSSFGRFNHRMVEGPFTEP
jgi:hypothetical protein